MNQFAENITLNTKGKLNEEDELPTESSLRGVMRRFYNAWERHYNLEMPLDIKRSMAPYIQGLLAEQLGLKDLHKD
ncbi:hypothetical protein B0H67DRAFT_670333 [Lasiosphaeris hirsuta]|uniref:Uncharacterized protein n=1 Tax=Lasiosphaeris hirsuta TaxID=260670 RepID=A0AA40DN70_9PEZI|nr:hypothetical protein B0H67DRAFT_670333 [Lasiosphaeris hirsuta]